MATHIIDRWQFNEGDINTLISGDTYIIQNYIVGDWSTGVSHGIIFNTTINGDDDTPGVQAIIDLSLIGDISLEGIDLFNINFVNGIATGGYIVYGHNCIGYSGRKYVYVNLDLSWNETGYSGIQWDPFSFIEWRNYISSSEGDIFYLRGSVDIPEGHYEDTVISTLDIDQEIISWNKEKYGQWKIHNIGFSNALNVPMRDGLLSITHGEDPTTVFNTYFFDMWFLDRDGDGKFAFVSYELMSSDLINCVIKCCEITIQSGTSFFETICVLFKKSVIISSIWTDVNPPGGLGPQPSNIVFDHCTINKSKEYIINQYYNIHIDSDNQYEWTSPELPAWNALKELFHKSLILVGVTSPPSTGTPETYTDAWGNTMTDIGACYCGDLFTTPAPEPPVDFRSRDWDRSKPVFRPAQPSIIIKNKYVHPIDGERLGEIESLPY